jgi:bifunctional non-homologous end joining protein LigD
VEVSRVPFIPPAIPKLRASPPTGDEWLHEVKLDGFRAQLHKAGRRATIFGKNGGDLTHRFPAIAAEALRLPAKSCVIDGELIAADAHGQPDFRALLFAPRYARMCVYAFDILELQGRDLRDLPLEQRRARLRGLLVRAKTPLIRFSDSFPDADVLLAECARCGLEGIVCKRKDSVYRSGPRSGWVKVNTDVWKHANRDRGRLFEEAGRG